MFVQLIHLNIVRKLTSRFLSILLFSKCLIWVFIYYLFFIFQFLIWYTVIIHNHVHRLFSEIGFFIKTNSVIAYTLYDEIKFSLIRWLVLVFILLQCSILRFTLTSSDYLLKQNATCEWLKLFIIIIRRKHTQQKKNCTAMWQFLLCRAKTM